MVKTPVLSSDARAWVESVERKFNLEGHDRMLLIQAAQVHDEIAEAKALIAKEGLTIKTDRGGKKANPAVAVLANNRLLFSKLIRQLDLNEAASIPGVIPHSRKKRYA